MKTLFSALAVALLALAPLAAPAQDLDLNAGLEGAAAPAAAQAKVAAKLVADRAAVAPGETFTLGLVLDHPEHWHTYWKNPGDAGSVTTVTWKETSGATFGTWRLPAPNLFAVEDIRNFVYEGRTVLLLKATVPASAKPGDTLKISGAADWLECDDSSCNPKNVPIAITLPVKAAGEAANAPLFQAAETAIPETAPAGVATLELLGGDKVALKVSASALAGRDLASAKFFPSAPENPSSFVVAKPVADKDGALRFTFEKAEAVAKAGKLEGVITFEKGRALEVSAAGPFLAAGAAPVAPAKAAPVHSEAQHGLALTLLLAFGGGMLLNIMPCVFPVLGLKIYGFVNKGGQSHGKSVRHASAFAGGIVVSFWILAALIAALKAGAITMLGIDGGNIGWGFLQQIPGFNAGVAVIFLVMGLSMAGVFEFGTALQNAAGSVEEREGYAGSFLSGMLATLVATPCTGPMISPALTEALRASTAESFLIFTALALGLAIPFVVLAASPALLKRLPRPGPWMESFKQAMAFPLFAAFAYFAWILGAQIESNPAVFVAPASLFALFAFIGVAIACWIYGRWCAPHREYATRVKGRVLASLIALASLAGLTVQIRAEEHPASSSGSTAAGAHAEVTWTEWSPETQEKRLSEGKTVYIDFTAKWCATCIVNKRVYHDEAVARALTAPGVVTLRADWTNRSAVIAAELKKYDRVAIPFNVLLKQGEAPKTLPEILTAGAVLEAVGK